MRFAVRPTLRKLWGRIETDLEPANYTLQISNTFNVSAWAGEKRVVFTTMSALGGRHLWLPAAFTIAGAFCLAISTLIYLLSKLPAHKPSW